ncbi:hypothetical protein YC2023_113466 [Brassica napus]
MEGDGLMEGFKWITLALDSLISSLQARLHSRELKPNAKVVPIPIDHYINVEVINCLTQTEIHANDEIEKVKGFANYNTVRAYNENTSPLLSFGYPDKEGSQASGFSDSTLPRSTKGPSEKPPPKKRAKGVEGGESSNSNMDGSHMEKSRDEDEENDIIREQIEDEGNRGRGNRGTSG